MKYALLSFWLLCTCALAAQTAFYEGFESKESGLDLTTDQYQLNQNTNYTGTVAAMVAGNETNKFAQMTGNPSGAAQMEISTLITVDAGTAYSFAMDSRGPFKRQLRVYTTEGEILASSEDYKPAAAPEETAWKNMQVSFVTGPADTQIRIAFYHYWSGKIDMDNIKVEAVERQSAYYLSSTDGNDDNSGTKDAPWKTLDKISAAPLIAGDTVFFKRGDRFNGHFVVNGSGTPEKPILITAFGEGDKPILTGEVGAEGGGDYEEAILVENQDNLIFDGLEVQNERLVPRPGVNDTDASGLQVRNNGDAIMRNFTFRNMTFRNVFAVQPILERSDFDKIQVSGLRFITSKNTEAGKEKHIRDVLIEDCYFTNLQRFGVQLKHGQGAAGIGNDSINRNMNIVCRNNEFYYNGGTAVLPNATYNCLIENNLFDHPGASTDPRMPARGSSVWNINCINTVVQYNTCLSTRGYLDSHGIHIDHTNTNTFVQYNYMEDCEGGFVEILRANTNAVYRFNVSVNDGWRKNLNWANSNHTIWINSSRWDEGLFNPCDSIYIYNNTVVIDTPFTTSVSMDSKHIFIYNNIFSSTNGAGLAMQESVLRDNDTPFYMRKNLFEGTVNPDFISMDSEPVLSDPKFESRTRRPEAYQLQAGSPAINAGVAISGPVVKGAGKGVFKNVPAYPVVDFYGNPISLLSGTPNIGASNQYNGVVSSSDEVGLTDQTGWLVYPMPKEATIRVFNRSELSGAAQIALYRQNGQLIQAFERNIQKGENTIDLMLNTKLSGGIYTLTIRTKDGLHSRQLVWL